MPLRNPLNLGIINLTFIPLSLENNRVTDHEVVRYGERNDVILFPE